MATTKKEAKQKAQSRGTKTKSKLGRDPFMATPRPAKSSKRARMSDHRRGTRHASLESMRAEILTLLAMIYEWFAQAAQYFTSRFAH